MMISRLAGLALRPYVSRLWATDGLPLVPADRRREHVLPTGAMHLVIRLGDVPLRLFAHAADPEGRPVGTSVIGGVRDTAYVKCMAQSSPTVGAMLRPGVAELVSNTPAGALAGRHTCLEDLWHASDLAELRERLAMAPTSASRLTVFEAFLFCRLRVARGVNPLVAHALVHLEHGKRIGELVAEIGVSHRHLVQVFTSATGLSPTRYARLRRFNRVIEHLHSAPDIALADVAALFGYADQPHMTREFRAIADLAPGNYRRVAPAWARHVPVGT
jgi:AraC-like DNA-binding protein